MVTIWGCKRCGEEWAGRFLVKPMRCAKCGSPYWDRERGVKPGRAPVSGGKEAVCGVDVLEKSNRDVGPDVQKDMIRRNLHSL